VAFAAAVEETAGQIDVDLDGAEHRNVGGRRGGYGGGHHGGRGGGGGHHGGGGRYGGGGHHGGWGRKRRSVDEILEPVAVQIADQDVAEQFLSPYVDPVDQVAISADQDVAEQRYGGHGGYGGGRGGFGGRGGHHGGGGRYGRSLEEAQPVIVAEFQPEYVDYVSDDLQLAENRYSGNRGYGDNGNHGSGGYRGRRSVEEIAGAIEDLEVAEHNNKGYNRGGSSGGSRHGNYGSSSAYGRPSGGYNSQSGHGGHRRY
jgi:hypothetical protein